MKKNIFIFFLSIAFIACSNDENVPDAGQNPKGLVFEIAAKTQLNETKAGTPVYSQDSSQNIARISILAFKHNGTDFYYTKTYEISDWIVGSTFKSYTVPEADKLPEGNYSFLAIGRDSTDLYQITTPVIGTTTIGNITATIAASGDEYEIFSGTTQDSVYTEGTRVELTMTRRIAGILGYFKNVPQVLNGQTVRYLKLTANAGNKEMFVANGSGLSRDTGYDIINIDLSSQTVVNGIYTGNDLTSAGVVKLPNSQLAGAYMFPILNLILTVGLYDENNIAIKTWQVSEGASTTLNFLSNHFYSLGVKKKPDTTTGGTTDPTDDDSAIDLLQDQVITISIDPAWNTIHQLDIQ